MNHHPYGFSKWPALIVCPHYESDDRESAAAKAGTENHLDFSECINEVNTGIPAVHGNDNAMWAAQFINGLNTDNVQISNETTVKIPDYNDICAGIYGTCDAHFIDSHGNLYVFDYKSGAQSIIDYMPQVAGYAYAICMTSDKVINVDTIQCYVLYGAEHKFVRRGFTFSKLRMLAEVVNHNIEVSKAGDTKVKEPCANGYCQYCKYSKECKAMAGEIIKFKNNEVMSMTDAKLYEWCVSAKAAIETWMEDLKQRAKDNGGVIDDGDIRYELRTDKRGRMQTVDVPQLWYDMSDKGCSVTQDQLMKACTISKKSFTDLYKADAKAHGILVKDVEAMYTERCTFGEPASKLVKVEAKKEG